ncbi:hypothetical protein B0H13DRAFT_1891677 [Mycena leptocephala]|nr:hypothetical protein B0H13DRAFT_1891677 [Mycena leptocephala]
MGIEYSVLWIARPVLYVERGLWCKPIHQWRGKLQTRDSDSHYVHGRRPFDKGDMKFLSWALYIIYLFIGSWIAGSRGFHSVTSGIFPLNWDDQEVKGFVYKSTTCGFGKESGMLSAIFGWRFPRNPEE